MASAKRFIITGDELYRMLLLCSRARWAMHYDNPESVHFLQSKDELRQETRKARKVLDAVVARPID